MLHLKLKKKCNITAHKSVQNTVRTAYVSSLAGGRMCSILRSRKWQCRSIDRCNQILHDYTVPLDDWWDGVVSCCLLDLSLHIITDSLSVATGCSGSILEGLLISSLFDAIITPVRATKYTGPCGCIVIWSILSAPETQSLHYSHSQLLSTINKHSQHMAVLCSSAWPPSTEESALVQYA